MGYPVCVCTCFVIVIVQCNPATNIPQTIPSLAAAIQNILRKLTERNGNRLRVPVDIL